METLLDKCEKCGGGTYKIDITGGFVTKRTCKCNAKDKISPALRPLGSEDFLDKD